MHFKASVTQIVTLIFLSISMSNHAASQQEQSYWATKAYDITPYVFGTGLALGGGYMYRDIIKEQFLQSPKETLKKAACIAGALGANAWLWSNTSQLGQERVDKKIVKERQSIFSGKSALLALLANGAVLSCIHLPANVQKMLFGSTVLNVARSLGYARWSYWTDKEDYIKLGKNIDSAVHSFNTAAHKYNCRLEKSKYSDIENFKDVIFKKGEELTALINQRYATDFSQFGTSQLRSLEEFRSAWDRRKNTEDYPKFDSPAPQLVLKGSL